MKKYFTGFVVGMVLLGMSGSSVSAQTINANELVELFISLGIISGSQASTARSAVGTSNTGSISSSPVTQTPSGVSRDPFQKKPSVKITTVCRSAGCNEPTPIAGQSVYIAWDTQDVPGPGEVGGGETFSFKLIKASAIDRARQNMSLVASSDIIDLGRVGTHFGQANLFIPSTVPTGSYYMYVGDWSFSEARIRDYVQTIYNTKNGSLSNPIDYSYDIAVVTQAYLNLRDFKGPFTVGNGSGSDGQGDFTARLSGGSTTIKSGFNESVTISFSYDPYFVTPGTRGSGYGGLKGDDFTVVAMLRPVGDTPVSEFSSYYNKNVGAFWFPGGTGRGFNGRGTLYLNMPPDVAPGTYNLELQFQSTSYQVSQSGITQPWKTVLVAQVTVEAGAGAQFQGPDITSFSVSPTTVSLGSTMTWSARATAGSSRIKQHRAYVLGGLGSEQTGWTSVYGQNASLDVSVAVNVSYASSANGFGNRGSGTYTIRYEVEDVAGNISFEDRTVIYNGPTSSGGGSVVISPADSINAVFNNNASVSIAGPASFTTQDTLVRWPLSATITNTEPTQEMFAVKGYITYSTGVPVPGTTVTGSTGLAAFGSIARVSLADVVVSPTSIVPGRYVIVAELYRAPGGNSAHPSAVLLTRNTKSVNLTSAVATPSIYTPSSGTTFTPGAQVSVVVTFSGTTNQSATDPSRVAKTELYDNGEKVAEVVPSTLNAYFTWIPSGMGTHTLVVKNVAVGGATASSQPVTVSVVGSQGSGVSVPSLNVSPSGTVVPGTSITATLTPQGTVSSVEFFVNGVRASEDRVAPYTFTWTPTVLGTYVVTARVYGQNGAYSTSNGATVRVATSASGGGIIIIPATGDSSNTGATYTPAPRRCVGNCGGTSVSPTTGSIIIEAVPTSPAQSVSVPSTPSISSEVRACPLTLTTERGLNGTSKTCYCASAGSSVIWGSNPYTDDSSICIAAKHSGIAVPGNVTYTITPGQSTYTGSTQNGVTSQSYGSWGGSFTFSR
jgi:hypothetical protein